MITFRDLIDYLPQIYELFRKNFAAMSILILGCITATFFITRLIYLHENTNEHLNEENYKPIAIVGKTFRNEIVPLDGYAYSDDTFENVTFVYNGTTPLQFTHNTVGGFVMKSDNPAINYVLAMLYGFGLLDKNKEFIMPAGTKIDSPK
jgi:hypothetical protein